MLCKDRANRKNYVIHKKDGYHLDYIALLEYVMHTKPDKCAGFATEMQGKAMYAHKASVAHAKRQPESPLCYASHASYYDHLYQLETAFKCTHCVLPHLSLLSLLTFACASILSSYHL
jgi:hypothetical protein